MTATVPTRTLAILGLAVAALAAFFLVVRPMLHDDSTSTPAAASKPSVPSVPSRTPAQPAVKPARQPAVRLLPGLPANVARALRREPVVVASVWAPGTGDAGALTQARNGAKAAEEPEQVRAGVRAGLAAATEAMARGRLVRHADAAQELALALAQRHSN